jgi:small subunit ribosomal protein S9
MEKEKTTKKPKIRKKAISKEKLLKNNEVVVEIKEEVIQTEVKESKGPLLEEEIGVGKEKKKRYFEAVGRRKTAIARVRLFTIKPFEGDEGKITVNGKFYKIYFPSLILQQTAEAALRRLKSLNRFEAVTQIKGGGIQAQAEALRHGLARVLVLFNQDFRKKLKKAGYMKRDPRVKERRKYGLKKARKAPQWQKR